jgi:hypothetical protein
MLTKRQTTYQTIALATDDTSAVFDLSGYGSGEIGIPSGSSITTLTYFVPMPMPELPTSAVGGVNAGFPLSGSAVSSATYFTACDHTGTAITQTVVAGDCYPIPADLFGSAGVQIRANAAGTVFVYLKT